MRAKAPNDQERVFEYIKSQKRNGATDDEVEVALDLIHQNASARRRALELDGRIVKTDRARKTRRNRWAAIYTLPEYAYPYPPPGGD